MKRIPSVDKIESIGGIDRADAIKIRRLLDGRDDPMSYEAGQKRDRECYFSPDKTDLILTVVDSILGTCGVETIHIDGQLGEGVADYCNNGQSYDPTILYDVQRDAFYVTSWADWVETAERNGRYKFQ